MKDKRIWEFKRRAEEDNQITAGACRLILRIASWRYCTKHHPADSEFALGWRDMASWYDVMGPEVIKRRETIYDWLRELVTHHYLFYNGRKGCPAKSCYRLDLNFKRVGLALFDWAAENGRDVFRVSVAGKIRQLDAGKIRQPDAGKTPLLDAGKNQQPDAGKNRPPYNSYSLREEMLNTKGKKSRSRKRDEVKKGGRKRTGSLRSRATVDLSLCDGKLAPSMPTISGLPAEDSATQGCDTSAAVETGGSNPPGGDRKVPALPSNWHKMKKEAGL